MLRLLVLLVGGLSLADVVAQTSGNQLLDIKLGTWQLTVTSRVAPYQPDIDKALQGIAPGQRAQVAASLKAAYAKGTVTKRTVTIKREGLIRGSLVTGDADCPKEITSSSQKLEVHFKCDQLDLVSRFERIDSENFTGTIQQSTKDTPPRQTTQTVVAKWIGEPPAEKAPQQPAAEQTITARITRLGNDYYSVVSNHSGVAMTGYAISITMYGNNQRVRHFYDLRMLNRPPIKAGASVQEGLHGIVMGATPVAAVFADGSAFGPAAEVADLMNRRKARLNSLTEIAAILCDAQQRGVDKEAAVASLESARSKFANAGTPMLSSIQDAMFSEAIEKLKRPAPSRPISIQEVLQGIQPLGMPLLEDPVRDPSGALYIKTTADQLSCRSAR
jgi:hypothetical protein